MDDFMRKAEAKRLVDVTAAEERGRVAERAQKDKEIEAIRAEVNKMENELNEKVNTSVRWSMISMADKVKADAVSAERRRVREALGGGIDELVTALSSLRTNVLGATTEEEVGDGGDGEAM